MSRLLRLIGWRVTSEALDAKLGQLLCFLASAGILLAGFYRLTKLTFTEVELVLYILLLLTVSLLGVILGVLLPIAQRLQADRSGE